MEIEKNAIKSLRDRTGISIMQCKTALEEAGGDQERAIDVLKEKGVAMSNKKKGRTLGAGIVGVYVHTTGDVGAMVELLCETDFVAKNDEFKQLANDLAMQVAAIAVEGKEDLLAAEFIKDPSKKIEDLIMGAVQKFGENTDIGEISRFSISGR